MASLVAGRITTCVERARGPLNKRHRIGTARIRSEEKRCPVRQITFRCRRAVSRRFPSNMMCSLYRKAGISVYQGFPDSVVRFSLTRAGVDFIGANRLGDQFGLVGAAGGRGDFDFGDEFPGGGRQLVPNLDGDDTAEQRERCEEDRPPMPTEVGQEAQAEGLQAGSQIGAGVYDSRSGPVALRPPKSVAAVPEINEVTPITAMAIITAAQPTARGEENNQTAIKIAMRNMNPPGAPPVDRVAIGRTCPRSGRRQTRR